MYARPSFCIALAYGAQWLFGCTRCRPVSRQKQLHTEEAPKKPRREPGTPGCANKRVSQRPGSNRPPERASPQAHQQLATFRTPSANQFTRCEVEGVLVAGRGSSATVLISQGFNVAARLYNMKDVRIPPSTRRITGQS
ncbi:uncharacterized protein EV422DRAFT_509692 [Fimicolochytrium jonesii]|uniref:uncharacterized protein n=1 Tax=Fimicolochytrium jonesii TaxID=1396493 RepID=UPI0022FE1E9B|nr:uncharacterized protein EV422DRAFT_509692 [Fimicolochytrium jonesii]KAI8816653.1 hypothetical protein EV422DRAFT_509692 [Fimicolochytrium jonesii]